MTTSSASELDWSETRKWIGRNLIVKPIEGADIVERSTIRRQLEVLEMDCPLHYDEAEAKRHGYQGIVAPVHMLDVYGWPAMWKPGQPSRWTTKDVHFSIQALTEGAELTLPRPPEATAGFQTDVAVEYLKPLYIGDRVIQTENVLVSVNPRKTRVGDGAFLIFEETYVNQRGEVVAKRTGGLYFYKPEPRQG